MRRADLNNGTGTVEPTNGSTISKPENSTDSILVVDDDARIRDLLRAALEAEHYSVHEAETSADLYNILTTTKVDLITMDVVLDQESGLDLVRDLRKQSDVPIILVTGRVDLIDTVMGLELGADDYITKPFPIREFIARVRSVLRRSKSSAGLNKQIGNANESAGMSAGTSSGTGYSTYRGIHHKNDEQAFEHISFGDWSINTASRELSNTNGQLTNLTTAEYDLLDIFVNAPQRVLSREHLMERLTGRPWNPSDRIIDNHVAQLRKKIEQDDSSEWIKTVRGAGYMFTGRPQRKLVEGL